MQTLTAEIRADKFIGPCFVPYFAKVALLKASAFNNFTRVEV